VCFIEKLPALHYGQKNIFLHIPEAIILALRNESSFSLVVLV